MPKCAPLNPMPNFNQSRVNINSIHNGILVKHFYVFVKKIQIYGNWYARMISSPFVLDPGNRCFTNNLVKINEESYIQLQSLIG
jgi:hypothetical protein